MYEYANCINLLNKPSSESVLKLPLVEKLQPFTIPYQPTSSISQKPTGITLPDLNVFSATASKSCELVPIKGKKKQKGTSI